MSDEPTTVSIATASVPGAVAIVHVHGPAALEVAARLTGREALPANRLLLSRFAEIDEGLAVRLRDDLVQLMPHGGPRVVQRLVQRLNELGATAVDDVDARAMYPESRSDIEADMLAALARAASPAAVDLLLAQPTRWRDFAATGHDWQQTATDSAAFQRLMTPSTVVVIGRPNAGKSTLTNRILGRAASVVADLPGTTRDWVAALAELPLGDDPTRQAVAVRWTDTPGIRHSDDAIEQHAIELAREVIADADVLIALRDPQTDWPATGSLPRPPDVWVVNKIDDAAGADGNSNGDGTAASPLQVSAANGRNIDRLEQCVVSALGLGAIEDAPLWPFSDALKQIVASRDVARLGRYLAAS